MAARRIAFVVSGMEAGGAERVALNLSEACQSFGWEADLVLVSRQGPLLDEVPSHVRVFDLGAGRARHGIFALRRYLRQERPTAMVGVAFHVNLLASIARIGFARTRLVLSVHSTLSRAFAGHAAIRRFWLTAATRLLYRSADAVVAVSRGAAEDLIAHAGVDRARIAVIHNPIVRADFEQRMLEEADHPWARDDSVPLIVAAGRLTLAKDYPTLLRAVADVALRRPCRLLILGEGELRAELEALVVELGLSDRVAFAGFRPNPYPFMRAADLFVMSSSWEGFGNVLVEAMATGTPVVSTDCPHGPREILEDGKWGRLVPPGDPAALARSIDAVLEHGGTDATTRAREFTVEHAVERYLELAGN